MLLTVPWGTAGYASRVNPDKRPEAQNRAIRGTLAGYGSALRGMKVAQSTTSIPRVKTFSTSASRPAMAAAGTVSAGIDLRGCNLAGASDTYIYQIPLNEGDSFEQLGDLQYVMYCGYDDGKGRFYGVNFMSLFDIIFNTSAFSYDYAEMERWWPSAQMQLNPPYSYLATDLAYDPTSGNVYGCFYSEDGQSYEWGTVVYDYANSQRVKIADLSMPLYGVGVDAAGQYYAVAADGSFNKVDKTTGALTKIGDTGLTISKVCSGCYNDVDGNFLMAYANDSGSGLAAIDPATGVAVNVTDFAEGQQVTCLHIVREAQTGNIPAAPTLNVTCPDGTMNANVELTMPVEYENGTSAAGQTFEWSLMVNGVQNCTGTATAGEVVTRTIAMDEAGEQTFSASVSNGEGTSEVTITKCFIGKGAPAEPQNLKLMVDGGTATLTWDPVTTSSDGGYLNPAEVTYTVYDNAGKVMAEKLTATTWTTDLGDLKDYVYLTYVVRAFNGDVASMPVMSNGVGVGALEAPFTMDMTLSDNFARHTVADVNDDKHTWMYRNGNTYYEFSIVNDADDWLLTPRIALKADKYYMLRTVASTSYDGNPEYVEIKMGGEPAVEAMNTTVSEPFAIGFEPTENISVLHPAADGVYSLGYHAVSAAGDNFIYLKSYTVSAPMTGDAPAEVTDITVNDDPTSTVKAKISFVAPAKSVSGAALSGTLKVKVMRDGTLISEESCAPGSTNTVEDATLTAPGTYTYTLIPVSASGEEGIPAKGAGYVGPRTPLTPSGITLRQVDANSVELKWRPVTKDVYGNQILPENIGYDIYMLEVDGGGLVPSEKINDEPVKGNSFIVDNLDIPSQQQYCYMAVKAVTRGLESDMAYGYGIVGDAYSMPVVYTSQQSVYEHFLSYSGGGYPAWVSSDRYKVPGQDGDGEFLITINDITTDVTLETGKVKLSDKEPVLVFYIWKLPNSTVDGAEVEDENETEVSVVDGHDTQVIAVISNRELVANQWNKIYLKLADYRGKDVSVKIRALCKTYSENLYDNIRILEDIPCDLAASISAPESAYTGDPFDVNVRVNNYGSKEVGNYKVVLLRDGVEVDVKEVNEPVASNGDATVTFKQQLTLNDGDAVEYVARVVAEGDGEPSNDNSSVASVHRLKSAYPAPTGLRGETVNGDNHLAWNDVDVSKGFVMSMMEDVESADSWADALSGWTFVDVDNGDSGGFQGVPIPGHPQHSQYSFFVFDYDDLSNSEYIVSPNMRPYSGKKYLATMHRIDDGQIDDWAISPQLPGNGQTISFWARSYVSSYPETVEVWYSLENSTDPADFVKLDDFDGQDLPAEWMKYSATLPEGAVRFALRSCATGSFMLMVDDISYQIFNTSLKLTVKGFNVYCDGECLTDQPVSAPEFVHNNAGGQKHVYQVTAVYNYGESEYSEPLELSPLTAINEADALAAVVSVEGRVISVSETNGLPVAIMRADGVVLHRAAGDTSAVVLPGVYVVSVGGKAVKVVVR